MPSHATQCDRGFSESLMGITRNMILYGYIAVNLLKPRWSRHVQSCCCCSIMPAPVRLHNDTLIRVCVCVCLFVLVLLLCVLDVNSKTRNYVINCPSPTCLLCKLGCLLLFSRDGSCAGGSATTVVCSGLLILIR